MSRTATSVTASQVWLLGSALAGMGATIVMTIVVARFAPLAVLGFFALVGTIFSLARDVTDLGTSSAACREAARVPGRESEVIGQLLAWRLIPSALLAAGCLALAAMQDTGFERWALAGAGLIVLAGYNNGLFAVFQLRQLQSVPAAINIGINCLVLVGAAIVILSGADPLAFVLLVLLREAAIIVCNRWAAMRQLAAPPPVLSSLAQIRHWFIGPLSDYALAALAWHLLLNCGIFMIMVFASAGELGAFGAAFRLATPLFSLSWLMTAPLVPVFALAWQRDSGLFADQVGRSLELGLGVAALLGIIGAVLSPALVEVLLGEKLLRESGTLASDCLRWFMLAFAASIAVAVCAPALLAMGKERQLARIAWSGLAITLAAGLPSAASGRVALVAASIAAGMSVSAAAGLAMLRGARLASLATTFLPAAIALGVLLAMPAGVAAMWQVAAGCILGLGGIVALYLKPGMARYRAEQNQLAQAAAATSTGAGEQNG